MFTVFILDSLNSQSGDWMQIKLLPFFFDHPESSAEDDLTYHT